MCIMHTSKSVGFIADPVTLELVNRAVARHNLEKGTTLSRAEWLRELALEAASRSAELE